MGGREDFRRRAGKLLLEHGHSVYDADELRAMLRQQSGHWFNFLQQVWPTMSAEQLLHDLYTVGRRRRDGAHGVLSDTEAELLARPGARGLAISNGRAPTPCCLTRPTMCCAAGMAGGATS